jgi:hypothetical protein
MNGFTESTLAAVESGAYEHGLSTQLPNTSFPKFSLEVYKWHRCGDWQHKWGHASSELRGFGWGCDFLQPHHPSNIAVFVNGFPILIRLRGFKLDRFIADTAFRWSQFVDKSHE